jgi:serine protease Do
MKKYLLLSSFMLGGILLTLQGYSQDNNSTQQNEQNEEIIIRKKGDFPKNLTIQLNGNAVTINGKKPEDIKGDIEVIRKKSSGSEDETYGFSQPGRSYNGDSRGFSLSPVSPNKALLGVLTVPGDSLTGAKVEEVERGTPADSVGLQKGDIITRVNDTDIKSTEDLSEAIGQYQPGDKITVTYTRDGHTRQAEVTLGRNDNGAGSFGMNMPFDRFHFRGPFGGSSNPQNFMQQFREHHSFMNPRGMVSPKGPHLGMTVEARDDQKGLTVKQVEPGSPAQSAGFKPGDILSAFAGQKITSVDDIRKALDQHKNDQDLKATVLRDGHKKTLTISSLNVHDQANL